MERRFFGRVFQIMQCAHHHKHGDKFKFQYVAKCGSGGSDRNHIMLHRNHHRERQWDRIRCSHTSWAHDLHLHARIRWNHCVGSNWIIQAHGG
jgi:hypothetical protein